MQFLSKRLKMYKIGFTDSGIGSLIFTLDFRNKSLKELQDLSKKYGRNISLVQLGDNMNVPYSTKSGIEVNQLINNSLAKLEKNGVQVGVIACNTACVMDAKFPSVKKLYPMSIIEESAIELYKQANTLSKDNKINIIVMGTAPTIKSGDYTKALQKVHKASGSNKELVIHGFSAPEFVTAMEKELLTENKIKDIISKAMLRMEDEIGKENIKETLVVGLFCTHYPFFRKYMQEFLSERHNKDFKLLSQGEILSPYILNYVEKDLSKLPVNNTINQPNSEILIDSYFTSPKGQDIIQHNSALVFGEEQVKNIIFHKEKINSKNLGISI